MRHCRLYLVHVGVICGRHPKGSANSLLAEGKLQTTRSTSIWKERTDSVQLNTSSLGQIKPFGDSKPDEGNNQGGLGGLFDKGKDALQNVGNEAASAAGAALNTALDIPDFYTAHLMTHCEGDFKPDAKDPNAKGKVAKCSERKPFYSFDPAAIIESKLPEGFNLTDLKWPDEVTNGIKALNMISKAMFFFYIIGIAAAGIAMIGAVFGLLAYEHKVALANLGVNSVGYSHFSVSGSWS
jgi:hypothetical protein